MGNTLNSYDTMAKLHNSNDKNVKLHISPHRSEGSNLGKVIFICRKRREISPGTSTPVPFS
jgi:hypothetical protein